MYFEQVKGKENETFMSDFILFLKREIRAIFELEYMCSVFNFVQYIFYTFYIINLSMFTILTNI